MIRRRAPTSHLAHGLLVALALAVATPDPLAAEEEETPEPDGTSAEACAEDDLASEPELPGNHVAVPPRRRLRLRVEAGARAGAGAIQGESTTPGRGTMSVVGGHVDTRLDHGRLRLQLPLAAAHRQTFGADLAETRLAAKARATIRLHRRLKLAAEIGAEHLARPGWADRYQPRGDGTFVGTDRFGHTDLEARVTATFRPAPYHTLRVYWDYGLEDYVRDPAFDPIYDPSTLTPSDNEIHKLDAAYRVRLPRGRVALGAQVSRRSYFYMFARDARTGRTNTSNAMETNPLHEVRRFEPRVEGELELAGGLVTVGGRYELELQDDVWQGYYSYLGHHPELRLEVALPYGMALAARGEVFLRRYGPGSYVGGDGRPMLAYGDRRVDRRGVVSADLRVPIRPHWSAFLSAKAIRRRTNYPAFEPGVFPASRDFAIDWNYDNGQALVGVDYRY